MTTTIEKIQLADSTLPTKEVEVPEWGVTVSIVTLSVAQRSEIENKFAGGKQVALTFRQALLTMAVRNTDGTELWTADQIAAPRADAVERLFQLALERNGFTNDDKQLLSDAEKN